MLRPKPQRLTEDRAEAIALQVLAFVIADPAQSSRFLSLTGSSPDDLRAASSRELQTATLDYLLSDESLLLSFCQEAGIDPSSIGPAYQLLAGRIDD